jgi:hypothetical protein
LTHRRQQNQSFYRTIDADGVSREASKVLQLYMHSLVGTWRHKVSYVASFSNASTQQQLSVLFEQDNQLTGLLPDKLFSPAAAEHVRHGEQLLYRHAPQRCV